MSVVKILYVEDMETNVYVLENRLKRAGFTVLIAADGMQGIAVATAEQPDLIIMDLGLPVLDGWEATRRLKSLPETRHIPVIAVTASVMGAQQNEVLQAGFDALESKPVSIVGLLRKMRALLDRKSASLPT